MRRYAARAAGGTFVRHAAPLVGRAAGYMDTVGALSAPGAHTRTVASARDPYGGVLPLTQQPRIFKRRPYEVR